MKTLIIAINSQYVHTNLAVKYLEAACRSECGDVSVLEFSINENHKWIFRRIMAEKPDVVAFSCYIWNIEHVVRLAGDIKKAKREIIVIAGGPEVSFERGGFISETADYIICGEGEEDLPLILKLLNSGERPCEDTIKRLKTHKVIENLNSLNFPYDNINPGSLKDRIAYVEASRGCPFRCSYCISPAFGKVRYFEPEWVYRALDIIVESEAKVIKFVDRTFNADEKRAEEILTHIKQKYSQKGTVFHFEIDPGLLTDHLIDCLLAMPPGLVQIEAGIQSIHEKTLKAVRRAWHIDKALSNLKKILTAQNIHVHVDLIAGLPYESFQDFTKSFNRVYSLFAHHFQLGFLKMLRGSSLKEEAVSHGYSYRDYPPYEVISNNYITTDELLEISDIEACLNLFYNSGRLVSTMKYIYNALKNKNLECDPFEFYRALASSMRIKGYLDKSVKASNTYFIMYRFIEEKFPYLTQDAVEYMRLDYYRSMKNTAVPAFMPDVPVYEGRKAKHKWLAENRKKLEKALPRLLEIPLEKIMHQIHVSSFKFVDKSGDFKDCVIAVDFGDICPVTGLARAYLLK
ncbi:MAG: DUF4080 domain-containing protein [Bacillota bacterium]|jgi:radical SAM superfamily enzyme YgiQ (UPF0313 family)|nr:DUF4080 domain-containing protein [Bacillota bacterium]NLV63259.1 DUF4080 domain-containing protein [Clostridiaceae bacterium]